MIELAIFAPLAVFAVVAIVNALTFPRLKPAEPPSNAPPVSVLLPVRNEAAVLAQTVTSLLRQDYPALEILILDDQSEDGSAEIALAAAQNDSRLQVLRGAPLPPGWLGKPWACHQLGQRASGDYLLFTDADVHWEPGAISALMAEARSTQAHLLTAWPTQRTVTWSERLVVPLIGFAIQAYLPVLAVHRLPWPVFAAAMGQCLLFQGVAYQQAGGHAAIRAQVLDDMGLAYAIKRAGLRLRAADAAGLVATRMYHSWNEVRHGFAKNIRAGHANSRAFLVLSMFFHLGLFVFPWLLLFVEPSPAHAALCALGVLIRALTAAATRQRALDACLMPFSVILMTVITLQSFFARPVWKGRPVG